ncbi:MAG: hypothetical protein H0Z39_09690 [Peptococcaceae bacterium]|nr:hypothetical protein [Peptococcaceae bacterium]
MHALGLPRAMSYYYLYPFFKTFFDNIGVELVLSQETTKTILNKMDFCPTDEPCVAVKLLFAHAKDLLDRGIERVLVPCLVSLEPRNFCCPKFIGIPYMLKNALQGTAEVIIPKIDRYRGRKEWQHSFLTIGSSFGASHKQIIEALQKADQAQREFERLCVKQRLTTPEAYRLLQNRPVNSPHRTTANGGPVVGVIGHPYILYDNFCLDLLAHFREYGQVITAEMVPSAAARREVATLLEGERLWSFEAQILGAALHLLRHRKVDKLALLGSFECGPESIIEKYMEEEAERQGIPFLLLTVDEHTGEAGLVTRIEAFMDVQAIVPDNIQTHHRDHISNDTAQANFLPGSREEEFVIGMPGMGHLDVAIRSALAECGVKTIKTPHASKEILELGRVLAPEFVCLPFTITLGQMRWLLENGANKILMVGGKGKCRLGWYAQIQEQLLRRLGYDFEMIIIDSPLPLKERWAQFRSTLKHTTRQSSWLNILKALYFGYHKMAAIDRAERLVHRIRAFEEKRGTIDRYFNQFIRKIERASSTASVWKLWEDFQEQAAAIPTIDTDPVRVRIVGEIWVVLEAYVNLHLEEMLGKSTDPRVWVDREISATNWFHQHLFPTKEAMQRKEAINRASKPYLETDVGGHGHISVGLTALAKEEGIDGVIHLMPFTCMPEIVAQNILVQLSNKLDIPVLTFIITDQTGEAGFETRVEAFLDILKERRFTTHTH